LVTEALVRGVCNVTCRDVVDNRRQWQ